MFVVSNKNRYYLHVTNTDKPQWVKSVWNADKFSLEENAKLSAKRYPSAVVVNVLDL
jgi:hypothetical protein